MDFPVSEFIGYNPGRQPGLPHRLLFPLALGAAVVVGCAKHQPATLSGQVSFLDQPIPDGTIRLFPIQKTPGVGAAVVVVAGRYEFAESKVLSPGTYRVEIHAWRPTGRKIRDPEGGSQESHDEMGPFLPLIFNEQSILTVELTRGVNQRNFKLHPEGEHP